MRCHYIIFSLYWRSKLLLNSDKERKTKIGNPGDKISRNSILQAIIGAISVWDLSEGQITEDVGGLAQLLNLIEHFLIFYQHGAHETNGIDSDIIHSFLTLPRDHQQKLIAPNNVVAKLRALQEK